MDETEWLRSADAKRLLDHHFPISGFDSTPEQPRKLRLYLAALCRIEWSKLPPVCQGTTVLAEQIADGEIGQSADRLVAYLIAEQMTRAHRDAELLNACAEQLRSLGFEAAAIHPKRRYSSDEWKNLTWMALMPLHPEIPQFRLLPAAYHRADLVRCVFGNPFRPTATLVGRTRNDEVRQLAATIYRDREFSLLPILADMIEETDCDDSALLNHCREEHALHARGCWVLDLILRGPSA